LAIGIAVAMLSSDDKPGGIVVPTPSTQPPPALIAPSQTGLEPAIGPIPSTPARPATGRTTVDATILPGR
jgi:hypothetical protein